MADPQTIAADQILKLANQNGLTTPELYRFAKDFLIKNSRIEAFYVVLINSPPQVRGADDPEATDYQKIYTFMRDNSLLADFYSYLVVASPPISPLP